jgi:hypothetical protein
MATAGKHDFSAAGRDAEHVAADYERIKEDLSQLRGEFSALLSHLRSGATHAAEGVHRTAKRQVDERPVQTLLGAFVAGFVVSLLFGRLLR